MDLLQAIQLKLSDNKGTNIKLSELRSRFESVLKSNLSNSFEEEEDYLENENQQVGVANNQMDKLLGQQATGDLIERKQLANIANAYFNDKRIYMERHYDFKTAMINGIEEKKILA